MHWTVMDEAAKGLWASSDPLDNVYQFRGIPEARSYLSFLDSQVITVQSHERQALGADGDSGAPLFVLSKDGQPELAGVFCTHFRDAQFSFATRDIEYLNMQMFEPLKDHLAWIREVLAGRRGSSPVLEVKAAGSAILEEKQETSGGT